MIARFHDAFVKEPSTGIQQNTDDDRAGTFSYCSHVIFVATEILDILLDPFEGQDAVMETCTV